MEDQIKKQNMGRIFVLSLVYASGPLFFMLTDPEKIPLPLLILPFLWLFVVVFLSTKLILQRKTKASKKQIAIISVSLACLLVLLFVFQSIHQLTIRDLLISLAIIGTAGVYLLRADFIQ